jgi:hypothetical protein
MFYAENITLGLHLVEVLMQMDAKALQHIIRKDYTHQILPYIILKVIQIL